MLPVFLFANRRDNFNMNKFDFKLIKSHYSLSHKELVKYESRKAKHYH